MNARWSGVRKMLLAFSRDLRVVLLRLASRLQTLRFFAATKQPCPPRSWRARRCSSSRRWPTGSASARSKWELEDLSFRFLEPEHYQAVARRLDERRTDREERVAALRADLSADLAGHGIDAEVQGRPKHLYSIWKKMHRKGLDFARVLDVVALRVIVADVDACYAVLGRVHERYPAMAGELDDYIARPKGNGYRSLHTVVADDEGRAVEIQIRTREMDEHAEYGVSAHWAYKEAGRGRCRRARQRRLRVAPGAGAPGGAAPTAGLGKRDLAADGEGTDRPSGDGDATGDAAKGAFRRSHLRLHAAGGGRRAHRRGDADRLRLRGAHRSRPPLPWGQGRRPGGAAEHAARQRPRRSRSRPRSPAARRSTG